MIKLVTLDLDNTLWDADNIIYDAHRAMRDWLVNHVPDSAPLLEDIHWRTVRDQVAREQADIAHHPTLMRKAVTRQLLSPLELSPEEREQLVEDSFNIFLEGRNRVVLYPEAIELLEFLYPRVPVVAVTNGNSDLKKIGIAHYFKAHISAEKAGYAKPHPDIFRAALATVGAEPEFTLHVGDHPIEDIEAAQRMGMRTLWLNREPDAKDTYVQPDITVTSPLQLLDAVKQLFAKP